jgi:hypothetical protein
MGPFGTAYAYLGFSALLLAASGGLAAALPGRRRTLAVAGVLAAPAGALDVFFIPEYWRPVTVLGTRIGPEDFLFSFAVGVISCALAFGRALPAGASGSHPSVAWGRYAAVVASYVLWLAAARVAGFRVMDAAVIGMAAVGAVLLRRNPHLLKPGLRGAVSFCAVYLLALLGAFEVWPALSSQWSAAAASGARVLSVPSGEIFWALAYGGIYPILFASVADVRLAAAASSRTGAGRAPLSDLESERPL